MDTSDPSANDPVVVRKSASTEASSPAPPTTGQSTDSSLLPKGAMTVVIKTILVPIEIQDELSFKSLSYAVALGKLFGASVVLLHVIEEPALPQFQLREDSVRQARLLEEAEIQLKALFEREIAPHLSGRYIIREGRSCDTPVEVAKEITADLIVMFTHAWHGLARLINFCPEDKIVRSAPCPVLVVKEKEHEFITR